MKTVQVEQINPVVIRSEQEAEPGSGEDVARFSIETESDPRIELDAVRDEVGAAEVGVVRGV
jgi:hypothetical protein